MKKIFELKKNEKGFTLIELIIVIAILAIIAAVAVPNIIGAVDNSRKSADVANAKIILNAAVQVQAKDANASIVPATITDLSSAPAAGAANEAFYNALVTELNGSIPVPKYKGGDAAGASYFNLVVNGSQLSVTVTATGGDLNVAPTPDTAYNQN